MTISGKKINYSHFLFDGCHKFYLADKFTEDMRKAGYTENDFHPIDELPYDFFNSCPLRFIQTWEDFKHIVPQCRCHVTFNGFGKFGYIAKLDFSRNKVYTDEMMFKTSLFAHDSVVFKRMRK